MKAVSKYKKPEDMSWREIKELAERTTANLDRFEAGMEELRKEMRDLIRWSSSNYGNFGNRLGKVVELVVIPGARPILSRLGHDYDEVIPNLVKYEGKTRLFEVDMFMVNGTEAMALEVKTRVIDGVVADHIEQLKRLRAYQDELDIRGKTLYGCLAGVVIDETEKQRALDAGIYVLEIKEDEKRLNAFAPEAGKVGRW